MAVAIRGTVPFVSGALSPSQNFEMIEGITTLDIETHMGSCQFLKIIMPMAIASLLHRRCEFNSDYVKTHFLKDDANTSYVGFRSIIPKDHCVFNLHTSCQKMLEMIEKKYLKTVYIEIQDRATGRICEQYEFMFQYKEDHDDKVPRGRKPLMVASAFFAGINALSNENRFNENEINISFGWTFNNSMPSQIPGTFHTVKFNETNKIKYFQQASLKTKFHRVHLLVGLEENSSNEASKHSMEKNKKRSIQSDKSTLKQENDKHTLKNKRIVDLSGAVVDENVIELSYNAEDSFFKDENDWDAFTE